MLAKSNCYLGFFSELGCFPEENFWELLEQWKDILQALCP